MKRALALVVLLAMTTRVRADDRDAWQAAFAGSVTVALGGAITWWRGSTMVSEAEDSLCEGGAYPRCRASGPPLTVEEVDRLNAKGGQGETLATIGAVTTGVGLALAGFSFYQGFVAERGGEPRVVVTPAVSREGAGAALSVRW